MVRLLRSRKGLILATAAALAGAAALVLAGVVQLPGRAAAGDTPAPAPPAPQAQAVAVTAAAVTPRPVQREVRAVGTFYGHEEITVTPKVEGRVARIRVDVGDVVRPGDVLLEIDDIDHRLALTEAQKAVELELARVGLKKVPPQEYDCKELPPVVRARSLRENAETRLSRTITLGRAASQEEREKAQTDLQVAQANYDQTVLETQATLAAARHRQAVLEMTKQKLVETKVVVPDPSKGGKNGAVEFVVASRLVSEGEMVRAFPSQAVFKLVMDRPLKLQVQVPERHTGEVKIGQAVSLSVEAYPRQKFAGKVARVNPTVDRPSRTFQVEVQVPNEDRKLRAGSFVKAAIATHIDPAAATVPEEALVTFAGVTKIFVIRDGKAVAVPVKTGVLLEVKSDRRVERWVEVIGEVEAGAQVVTSGHTQLADGTPVRLRSTRQ